MFYSFNETFVIKSLDKKTRARIKWIILFRDVST